MSATDPFALFITWTCYGTWLPGDRRGYVSNMRTVEGPWPARENAPGSPYRADEPENLHRAQMRRKWEEVWLTQAEARCVVLSLIETAAKQRWRILRSAVMSNHVHVVVADCPDDGPAVRRILKGNTQAALTRHHGRPRKWWTSGGSNRYAHGAVSLQAAIDYVAEQEKTLAAIIDMVVVDQVRNG